MIWSVPTGEPARRGLSDPEFHQPPSPETLAKLAAMPPLAFEPTPDGRAVVARSDLAWVEPGEVSGDSFGRWSIPLDGPEVIEFTSLQVRGGPSERAVRPDPR